MSVFAPLLSRIGTLRAVRNYGKITQIQGDTICAAGLNTCARIGDRVWMDSGSDAPGDGGEILSLSAEGAVILPESTTQGQAIGRAVEHLGTSNLSPDDSWIGRVIDPFGNPLDGRPLALGESPRALRSAPPPAAQRKRLGARLGTGLDVFNTLLPLARGQRMGLFAGSGVGKTMLLGQLARQVQADVVVLGLVGERGRELREFLEDVLGPDGMARAVVVTATSDQSPLLRRRAALTAMTVAEHFRDQGQHVLLMIDSITRFAEAHREIALAAGEAPGLRGFPPSTAQQIMALSERAGPGKEEQGDITALFTVLVAGSDMEEPIADILRGVLDGHVVLDRAIAERGRFPAVDLLRSVSRSLPGIATPTENAQITEARRLIGAWERAEMMVQAGLYSPGSDPLTDRAIKLFPKLDGFLTGIDSASPTDSFARLKAVLDG